MPSPRRDLEVGQALGISRRTSNEFLLRPSVIGFSGFGALLVVVILGLILTPLAKKSVDSDNWDHWASVNFEHASSLIDLSVMNPTEGHGGLTLPIGVWLNPSDLLSRSMPFNDSRIAGLLVAMVLTGLATYVLSRSVTLPTPLAIIGAQFIVFVAFPPFLYWSMGASRLNLSLLYAYCRPGIAIHAVLGTLLLAAFCSLGKLSSARNGACVIVLPIVVLYSVFCNPLYAPLFFFPISFFLAGLLIGSPDRRIFWWRVVGAVFCLLVLLGLKLHTFYRGLFGYAARAVFPNELYVEIQRWDYLTNLFSQGRLSSVAVAMVLLSCGVIVFRGNRELRWFAYSVVVFELTLVLLSFAYVYSGVRWHLPLPAYLEYGALPIYVVVVALAAWIAIGWISSGVKNNYVATWLGKVPFDKSISTIYVSILCLPLLALIGTYLFSSGIAWQLATSPSSSNESASLPPDEIGNLIEPQLSLGADGRFRGSLASLVGVPGGAIMDRLKVPADTPFSKTHLIYTQDYLQAANPRLSMTGWWNRRVPTLEDNNHLVTPPFHFLFSRALARRQDFHSRNWVTVTKANPKLMAALGARFLLTDQPLNHALLMHVAEFTSRDRVKLHLYDIIGSNVGNYSPIEALVLTSASKAIELMASDQHSFQKVAIVHDESFLAKDLVPAEVGEMFFEPSGVRIRGRSRGRSLLVVPLQFSNSLQVEKTATGEQPVSIELFRVNLLQTGILFEGELDIKLRHVFGPLRGVSGRLQDIEDCRRLGIIENGEIQYPPDYQPLMIPIIHDLIQARASGTAPKF